MLILAGEKGFATGRSFQRNLRSVDDGASACGIVKNGCAQLQIICIRQKESAKVALRDSQQIRGECLHQTTEI